MVARILGSELQRLRVASLSAAAFLLLASYAIARPATESLFLAAHGSRSLPWVWLLVAGVIVATTSLYGRAVRRRGLAWLYSTGALLSAATLLVLLAGSRVPGIGFALYVWKDIYVVVLVEIFYSYADAVFPIHSARWLYGLFGAMSAVGGIGGSLLVRTLASRHGTEASLLAVPPLLLLVWLVTLPLQRRADVRAPEERPRTNRSLAVLGESPYLVWLLALVALVQIVITLVDFEFNVSVERAYPQTDERTAVVGLVYGGIDAATVALHALTGPVLRLAGVPLTLLSIPVLLGAGLGVSALRPGFVTVAAVKAASKCLDYTLFRAAKELLYIPLDYLEKTVGKSLVDMTTYRVAKAGASLLLVGMLALGVGRLVTPLSITLTAVWIALAVMIARRFRRRVSRSEEMRSR